MTDQVPFATANGEKGQPQLAGAVNALAEVSEALNGLRELADRVQPSTTQPLMIPADEQLTPMPAQQLSLELPDNADSSTPEEHDEEPSSFNKIDEKSAKKSAGEILREHREQAGLDLEDVADELKIKQAYLEAIEEGRYGDLPSRTYAVGFVRAYAQALRIEPDELVARCRAEVGSAQPKLSPPVLPAPEHKNLPGSALITACVVLAVVIYGVGYGFFRNVDVEPAAIAPPQETVAEEASSPPAAVSEPSNAAPQNVQAAPVAPQETNAPQAPDSASAAEAAAASAPTPPQSEPDLPDENSLRRGLAQAAASDVPVKIPHAKVPPPSRIKLRAAGDTEVRIMDTAGHVLAERLIRKGEAFYVPDNRHYSLATNNAGALKVLVDGREMPALGEAGEPMHNIPLNPADLLQAMGE